MGVIERVQAYVDYLDAETEPEHGPPETGVRDLRKLLAVAKAARERDWVTLVEAVRALEDEGT